MTDKIPAALFDDSDDDSDNDNYNDNDTDNSKNESQSLSKVKESSTGAGGGEEEEEEDTTTTRTAAATSSISAGTKSTETVTTKKIKKRKFKSNPSSSSSSLSSSKKKKINDNKEINPNNNNTNLKRSNFIDDAAILSGSENDSDDDSDDDNELDGNEYVKDDFVVDEDDDDIHGKNNKHGDDDGLLDSDDDSDDDDSDDDNDDEDGNDDDNIDNNYDNAKKKTFKKKHKRVNKMQDRLTQEDLDLIDEARGVSRTRHNHHHNDDFIDDHDHYDDAGNAITSSKSTTIEDKHHKPTKIDDLRNELFIDKNTGARRPTATTTNTTKNNNDTFDEEGMEDFIEDDVGVGKSGQYRHHDDDIGFMGPEEGVSEAQINEANDIFGTEFLDFMAEDNNDRDAYGDHHGGGDYDDFDDDDHDDDRRRKFRERGVGVDLGIDSDDDIDLSDEEEDDDDDHDLFGDNDDEAEDKYGKTAEQRAEALRLKREKRRLKKEERRKKKAEQRKAKLRRAFEPVQLIENFCTDRDDEIRSSDVPERFFDWTTPFHGPDADITTITLAEEEEAMWIAKRIPDIATEYALADMMNISTSNNNSSTTTSISIIESIIKALRYMHREKLEPEFIRKYRADEVTSPAVRNNLYRVMDEDAEWERLINAKLKVEKLLTTISEHAKHDEDSGADEETVAKLKEDLTHAKNRLDECVRDEQQKQAEIDALNQGNDNEDDDDDDDDLFGDDDDDDDDDDDVKKMEKKKQQKEALLSHLKTTQTLVTVCAEQVSSIEAELKKAEEKMFATQPGQKDILARNAQMCHDKLWHQLDYKQYLDNLTDYRHIMDLYNYLSLIQEGNIAVRDKGALNTREDKKKRSKRFDRDFYRTCVSQGLRRICYQFALSPFRAGIKLEDNLSTLNGFNWEKTLPGESSNSEESSDPRQWNAPVVEFSDPTSFASDLVSSGELVLLASMNEGSIHNGIEDNPDVNDPLRGCRYVAAMELAYEPRIRRHLRKLYKEKAQLTTCPSAKGLETIDFFHEYYGLHLLRSKKVADHFYFVPDEMNSIGLSAEEWKEMSEQTKKIERQSCLQYLNVMKAEKTGHVKVHIHLPFTDSVNDNWYKNEDEYFSNRDHQDLSPFVDELKKVYFPSDGDNDDWNNQREQIIRFALKTFLLPYFEMEMKRELREAAFKIGIQDAGKNLYSMSMEGPYRPSHLLGDNRFLVSTGDLPIVGVCCSSDTKSASYLAAVTERGEVSDHLAVPAGIQIDSSKIREKVIIFLMQCRPSAIVVGSHAGLSSHLVARKLGALLTEATERWNNRFIQGQDEDDDEYQARQDEFRRMYPSHYDDDEEEVEWKCNVEMVDDNIAQLFGRSVRGKKEFPDSAINLKCAISIARYAKDPLGEISYTWSVASDAGVFGTEMLFLNVHPAQRFLPKTLLLREYERVICRAVAEVGVDINLSCKYDHLHGLLAFVPGLGPRKAASLKHGLDRIGGVIATRKDLLGKRLVGPFVYNNAVAFLRIRDIDALSYQILHPLDDTRLHPQVYHRNNWATKIAIDALEMDNDEATNSGNDEKAIMAIRDIMEDSRKEVHRLFEATKMEWQRVYGTTFNVGAWDPQISVPAESWRDKVEELDLETFAEMLEKDGKGKWLSHLTMIKWEFRLPFEDPRKPMEPLEKEKLFHLLTGESDQTLCPGREVTGKVARISDFGAHLKLEGDVPAFIPLRDLADGHVESAEDIVQVGQIVTAIVTNVKKDHMSVDLSLKQTDLQRAPSSWERPSSLFPLDKCFDNATALKIEEEKSKEREERLAKMNAIIGDGKSNKSFTAIGRTGRVTNRACSHPAFRNKSHMEIEKELRDGGSLMVGDALIRPSKTNADVLSLHWLVREGVTKIIEIKEEDKDNDASIGNTLKVKNETFGSIDELLALYISPMNDRVEELIEHKKFLNKSESEVDTFLKDLKQKTPSGVFYYLCWNEKYAGYASLRYILNETPRCHHIGINPEGFNWCQSNYSKLDLLLNDFKKSPRGKDSSSNEAASSTARSRVSGDRKSRYGSRAPSVSRQAPKWTAPSSHVHPNSSSYGRPPPPSLPPPPTHAYPPVPPGGGGWAQQRPPPPSLPPPSQHRFPPVPPGYPNQ